MTKSKGIRQPKGTRGGYPPSTEPKACAKCKEVKPAAEFDQFSANRSGLASYCKACRRASDQRRYKDRRNWWHEGNRLRKYRLKKMFGLTIEQYDVLFETQAGLCAICGQPETAIAVRWERLQNLAVDHDHITGAIRGLLCDRCNRVLGWARDDPALLEAAATYLRKIREVPTEAS